jgi:hypothetical protein
MIKHSDDDEKDKQGGESANEDDGLLEWLGGLIGLYPVPPDVPPPMPSKVRKYFCAQVFNNDALRLMNVDGLTNRVDVRNTREFIDAIVDSKTSEEKKVGMVYTHPRVAYMCVASLKEGVDIRDVAVPEYKTRFRE